jgi:hypothetical protein
MFDSFSPLENLKAFAIAYAAGIVTAMLVSLYVEVAKENSGDTPW